MNTKKNQISVIIPAYNEEKNIEPLVQELQTVLTKLPFSWEILFVDDGSTDQTLGTLQRLNECDARVQFISFASNQGQSAALAAGFRTARGSVFITMDADMQNNPQDIPSMLVLYQSGTDMVAGWREHRQDSWGKCLASRLANRVRNTLSKESIRDTGCSLKIMRAEMARRLPMFTGMHRFLPTLMRLEGATVVETRVEHRSRRYGTSKYGIWDRAFTSFQDLLAIRWMQKRYIRYHVQHQSQTPQNPDS